MNSCRKSALVFGLLTPLFVTAAVKAQFTYATVDNSTAITGYTGPGGDVIIPSILGGLPVTRIAREAFYAKYTVTSITIPNSVTEIGEAAFYFCSGLTRATIGNGVVTIGDFAFSYCANLATLSIPNSVMSLGFQAFVECVRLTSVTIGSSVQDIGFGAFANCSSLTSIRIPGSVTSIGSAAFDNCDSLTAITVDAANSAYSSVDGILFDKSQTTLLRYPGGRTGRVTIPSTVIQIGLSAFSYAALTSVTLPASLTSIGDYAFSYCASLKGVYFLGPAPSASPSALEGSGQAIVYYLPGKTGWTSTFAGRPTAPWQPVVRTDDGNFGVRANQFGFTINWATDYSVVVEACTNLTNPIWSALATNTLAGGSGSFRDPDWARHPRRFYRLAGRPR